MTYLNMTFYVNEPKSLAAIPVFTLLRRSEVNSLVTLSLLYYLSTMKEFLAFSHSRLWLAFVHNLID